jgi:Zn-dependent protease
LALLAFLQATGLLINLLPIPGLDGFGVIRPFLSKKVRKTADRLGHGAGFFLLGLILFMPSASESLFQAALGLTDAFALPREGIAIGWDAFTFWN